MYKSRLEAFSDWVIAIIITIMVLELKIPHGETFDVLKPLIPLFLSYFMSFVFIGIYWNNHHHLFQATNNINWKILWANMHLLFWLSLVPFATWWMWENNFSSHTVILYWIICSWAWFSYSILTKQLLKIHKPNSILHLSLSKNYKQYSSIIIYALWTILAYWFPFIGYWLFILVSIIWLVPDSRIEKLLITKK